MIKRLLFTFILGFFFQVEAAVYYHNPGPGHILFADYDSSKVTGLTEEIEILLPPESILENKNGVLSFKYDNEVYMAFRRPETVRIWQHTNEDQSRLEASENAAGKIILERITSEGERIPEKNFKRLKDNGGGLLGIELRRRRYYLTPLSFPTRNFWHEDSGQRRYRVTEMSDGDFRVWENTLTKEYGILPNVRILSSNPEANTLNILLPNGTRMTLKADEKTLEVWSADTDKGTVIVERTDQDLYKASLWGDPDSRLDFKIISIDQKSGKLEATVNDQALTLKTTFDSTRTWICPEKKDSVGKYYLREKNGQILDIAKYSATGKEELDLEYKLIAIDKEKIEVKTDGKKLSFSLPPKAQRSWSQKEENGDLIWAQKMSDGKIVFYCYPHQMKWKTVDSTDFEVFYKGARREPQAILRIGKFQYNLKEENRKTVIWDLAKDAFGDYRLIQKNRPDHNEYYFSLKREIKDFSYKLKSQQPFIEFRQHKFALAPLPQADQAWYLLDDGGEFIVNRFGKEYISFTKDLGNWIQTSELSGFSSQKEALEVKLGDRKLKMSPLKATTSYWKVVDFTTSGNDLDINRLLPAKVILAAGTLTPPYKPDSNFLRHNDKYFRRINESVFADEKAALSAREAYIEHNTLALKVNSMPPTPKLALPFPEFKVNSYPFGFHYIDLNDNYDWGYHVAEDHDITAGTKVSAIGDGVVVYTANHRGKMGERFGLYQNYGGVVIVAHRFKKPRKLKSGQLISLFYSLYGHIDEIKVDVGQRLKLGEELGRIATGFTPKNGLWNEEHLHFGIFLDPNGEYFRNGFGVLTGYDRPKRYSKINAMKDKFLKATDNRFKLWGKLAYQSYISLGNRQNWRPGYDFVKNYTLASWPLFSWFY